MYPDIVDFWSWDQYIEKVDGWFFSNFTRPIPCRRRRDNQIERTDVGANNQSPPSIEIIDELESVVVAQSLRPDTSTLDIEDAIFDTASSITLPSLETMSTGLQDGAVYWPPKKSPAKMFATTEIVRALSAPIITGSLQGGYYGIISNSQPPSPLPWQAPIQVEYASLRDFSPAFTKAFLIYRIMMCKIDTSEPNGWMILAVLNYDLETERHHLIGRPVYWLTLKDLHRQPACSKLLAAMKATRKF
ncbi:hypothetical protein BT69DRAFT_1295183 [Atractiella rhizophila]|nr:hypothetical protein BT69DRAFT_1295183 [Atractiella rhizophila]